MPRGVARKKSTAPAAAPIVVPLSAESEPSQPVADDSTGSASPFFDDEQLDAQDDEVEQALPQADITAPAPDAASVAALTQQLQVMQQIIMMQQQQMRQQQQQFKAELEDTKRLILSSQTSTTPEPTIVQSISSTEPEFTAFRATVPMLPQQARLAHTAPPPAPRAPGKAAAHTSIENMRLQQRLGLVDDTIVRTAVNPVISPLAEFKLGSTYVTEAGLM
jgi:hypothetical protein